MRSQSEHTTLEQHFSRVSGIWGDCVASNYDVHVGRETSGCNPVPQCLMWGKELWQEGLTDPCSRDGFVLAARSPLPQMPALSCAGKGFQYAPPTAWPTVLNVRFPNLASFPRILQIMFRVCVRIKRCFVSRHSVWSCRSACFIFFFSSFQFWKYFGMDLLRTFGKEVSCQKFYQTYWCVHD